MIKFLTVSEVFVILKDQIKSYQLSVVSFYADISSLNMLSAVGNLYRTKLLITGN